MFRLELKKKSKLPSIADFQPKSVRPSSIWTRIVLILVSFAVIFALFASYLLWKVQNEDTFRSIIKKEDINSSKMINIDRLERAVEAILKRD